MNLKRAFGWLVFLVGSAGALLTGLLALDIAGWLLPAMTGQWGGDPLPGLLCVALLVAIGLGALFGIWVAYRMLRRGRWVVMAVILAVCTMPIVSVVIYAKSIGPIYDDQGRLIDQ